jgi:hypothetical protein
MRVADSPGSMVAASYERVRGHRLHGEDEELGPRSPEFL